MKKIFFFLLLSVVVCGCCKRSDVAEKIRLNVSMSVAPENYSALMDNLLQLAEASRAENGCIGYEIYQNSRDSLRLLIVETWESQSTLDAHQQTEHFLMRAPINSQLSYDSRLDRFTF